MLELAAGPGLNLLQQHSTSGSHTPRGEPTKPQAGGTLGRFLYAMTWLPISPFQFSPSLPGNQTYPSLTGTSRVLSAISLSPRGQWALCHQLSVRVVSPSHHWLAKIHVTKRPEVSVCMKRAVGSTRGLNPVPRGHSSCTFSPVTLMDPCSAETKA